MVYGDAPKSCSVPNMSNRRTAEGERSNVAVAHWQYRRAIKAARLFSNLAGVPIPQALAMLGRLNYFEHAHILALLEDEANPQRSAPRTSGDSPAMAAVFAAIDNPAPADEGAESARLSVPRDPKHALALAKACDTDKTAYPDGNTDTGAPPRAKLALILLRGSQEPNAPTCAHQGATRHRTGVASLKACA